MDADTLVKEMLNQLGSPGVGLSPWFFSWGFSAQFLTVPNVWLRA